MHGIFFKSIKRRQIHATTKPTDFTPLFVGRRQHPHIHMHGGHIRIAGVKHQ